MKRIEVGEIVHFDFVDDPGWLATEPRYRNLTKMAVVARIAIVTSDDRRETKGGGRKGEFEPLTACLTTKDDLSAGRMLDRMSTTTSKEKEKKAATTIFASASSLCFDALLAAFDQQKHPQKLISQSANFF